jgi:hypothetical protein
MKQFFSLKTFSKKVYLNIKTVPPPGIYQGDSRGDVPGPEERG